MLLPMLLPLPPSRKKETLNYSLALQENTICPSPLHHAHPSAYLWSVWIVADGTGSGVICLNGWWGRSKRSFVGWRRLAGRFCWSASWFGPPLRWIDLCGSGGWLVGWWEVGIIVERRWHGVHSVLAVLLLWWVLGVVDSWVLVCWIICCPITSAQKPL